MKLLCEGLMDVLEMDVSEGVLEEGWDRSGFLQGLDLVLEVD